MVLKDRTSKVQTLRKKYQDEIQNTVYGMSSG
jgi:hypothetical protein